MILIAQCLCGPARHCILAVFGDDSAVELEARLRVKVLEMVLTSINPWCALCGTGAKSWVYEVAETRFQTMAEAAAALAPLEAANRATHDLLVAGGRAFDSAKRRNS
jgi:hypothetical protein